ncbi:MAG TPA: L-lysine 6-transaminase [Candidatus Limnocylindria bacterium]|nr:L-lysine 6-transaminase [Candidatus Limnocylindria bacterium]
MTKPTQTPRIAPGDVHEVLGRHLLVDGYDIVLDLEKSQGRRFWDARGQRWYLDLFSCFATLPIGINHPKMQEPEFLARLTRAALTNPTNSDIYTVEMAEFVDAFGRLAMPEYLPHLFLVAGGTLGIENALKAAFDWKVRQNFRKGIREERGHQVLHFRESFHGRSGYALSLTNTSDPKKHQYFPKFDWPRVDNPKLRFPVDGAERERVQRAEAESLAQIQKAFAERKDEIACIILEPIQAEGGDNHFRPEFLRALRQVADENAALLIFDEVQTGMGLTGRMWAHQHWDVRPDLLAFGKKTQICGMMAGGHLDDEPDNVFKVSSRLNSTWGGNLVDMVRAQRYLEIIAEERLVEHAAEMGKHLRGQLERLQAERPDQVSNVRGLGLMCAIDLPDGATRDAVAQKVFELGAIILPCGTRSLRFRTPLDVTREELNEGLELIRRSVGAAARKSA